MQPTPLRRLQPHLGWLLLAQILWIPLLLRLWSPAPSTTPADGRVDLPPLPQASEHRSQPPSLGELLAPAAPQGEASEREGSNGSGSRDTGLILLNRPGSRTSASAATEPVQKAQTQPSGNKPAQAGGNPAGAHSGLGAQGNIRPSVTTSTASPAQLLGGSLGLEDLRR